MKSEDLNELEKLERIQCIANQGEQVFKSFRKIESNAFYKNQQQNSQEMDNDHETIFDPFATILNNNAAKAFYDLGTPQSQYQINPNIINSPQISNISQCYTSKFELFKRNNNCQNMSNNFNNYMGKKLLIQKFKEKKGNVQLETFTSRAEEKNKIKKPKNSLIEYEEQKNIMELSKEHQEEQEETKRNQETQTKFDNITENHSTIVSHSSLDDPYMEIKCFSPHLMTTKYFANQEQMYTPPLQPQLAVQQTDDQALDSEILDYSEYSQLDQKVYPSAKKTLKNCDSKYRTGTITSIKVAQNNIQSKNSVISIREDSHRPKFLYTQHTLPSQGFNNYINIEKNEQQQQEDFFTCNNFDSLHIWNIYFKKHNYDVVIQQYQQKHQQIYQYLEQREANRYVQLLNKQKDYRKSIMLGADEAFQFRNIFKCQQQGLQS